MNIDALKGGTEGVAAVMDNQRIHPVNRQPDTQAQNSMDRSERNAGVAKTETGAAVPGLGGNLDLMV